jgi:hypothetical protein
MVRTPIRRIAPENHVLVLEPAISYTSVPRGLERVRARFHTITDHLHARARARAHRKRSIPDARVSPGVRADATQFRG